MNIGRSFSGGDSDSTGIAEYDWSFPLVSSGPLCDMGVVLGAVLVSAGCGVGEGEGAGEWVGSGTGEVVGV